MKENMLRWFSHVIRGDDQMHGQLNVEEKRELLKKRCIDGIGSSDLRIEGNVGKRVPCSWECKTKMKKKMRCI